MTADTIQLFSKSNRRLLFNMAARNASRVVSRKVRE